MKRIVNSILLTGALALGVSGLMAESNNFSEQWYKRKYGRPSPAEEARLKAERESTAFREESATAEPVKRNWIEDYFKAKLNRNTPAEEKRLKDERESSAFREEPTREPTPIRTRFDEWYHKKYGRYPGK